MSDEERETYLDTLVNDWLDARTQADKYQSIADEIAAMLVEQVGENGRHMVGDTGIGVAIAPPSNRFQAGRAVALLTPEQLAAISESVPLASKARGLLPPALFDQLCERTGRAYPRVVKG